MKKLNTAGFNIDEAKTFVKKLLEDVFADGKVDELADFYTPDVVGHWEDELFYFNDIKNRVAAIKKDVYNCHFKVQQIFVIDNLIIFSCNQSWTNKVDKSFHDSLIFGTYKIRDKKISEAWLITDLPKPVSYTTINQNFAKHMRQFELNNRSKHEFLRQLQVAKKSYPELTLSNTEEECLYYYFHGFSSKETALELALSYRTVETYIAQIKEKLGCSNKIQLRKKLFPDTK